MYKYLTTGIIAFILLFGINSTVFGAFSDPFTSIQLAPSPLTGNCLTTNGSANIWSTCASGGSSGGTWSTTTSSVLNQLINYSNNTTDIVTVGGTSTSTAKFYFDPNSQIGYFSSKVGIGTSSPAQALTVRGSGSALQTLDCSVIGGSCWLQFSENSVNRGFLGYSSNGGLATGVTAGDMVLRTQQNFHISFVSTPKLTFIGSTGNLGIGTTSPFARLSVAGGDIFVQGVVTSTSTSASTLPYASTTALSSGTLCLTSDTCRTTWPTGTITGVTGTYPIISSGGTAPNITFNGLSTSSPAVIGNIPYFSGSNTFSNVATTSVTCSGGTTCNQFSVIGNSPISISSAPSTAGNSSTTTDSYSITTDGTTYYAYNQKNGFSSNSSDLDTVWSALTADAGSTGSTTINFGSGTFVSTVGMVWNRSNVTYNCSNSSIVLSSAATDGTILFGVNPTNTATNYALTAQASRGDLSISISSSDASNLSVGDYIMLSSNLDIDNEFSGRKQGDIYIIQDIVGGTIRVGTTTTAGGMKIQENFLLSDSPVINRLPNFYENVTVNGCTFTDQKSSRSSSMNKGLTHFQDVYNLTLNKNNFRNLFDAGVQLWSVMSTKLIGNDFRDIKDVTPSSNLYYGIEVRAATTNLTVTGNTFHNMRHGFTQGAGNSGVLAGRSRNITVSANSCDTTTTACFDLHQGAENVVFDANVVGGDSKQVGGSATANGIQSRSPVTITNNTITNVSGKGIYLFGQSASSTINSNHIYYCGQGIVVDEYAQNISIKNNDIMYCTGSSYPIEIIASINTSTTTTGNGSDIQNNKIIGNASSYAIVADSASNLMVTENRLSANTSFRLLSSNTTPKNVTVARNYFLNNLGTPCQNCTVDSTDKVYDNTGYNFDNRYSYGLVYADGSHQNSTSSPTVSYIYSTSTTPSTFPYASTTALSGTTICLSTDCRTVWPSAGGGVFPFLTTTNFNQAANSTTTALWLRGSPISLMASSTAVFDYASTTALTVLGTSYLGTVASGNLSGAVGLPLTTGVTGILPIVNGGTNNSIIGASSTVAISDGSKINYMSTSTLGLQQAISLTTTGSSGASTLSNGILNIPQYNSPFPFTPTTNFNANTNATGTPAWFQAGIQASTTSQFDNSTTTIATVTQQTYNLGSTTVGTAASLAPLTVQGANSTNATMLLTNGTNQYQLGFLSTGSVAAVNGTVGNVSFGLRTNSVTRIQINGNGNVGIGTTTPAAPFAVQGAAYLSSTLFVGQDVTSTSTFQSTSLTNASTFPYASTTALSATTLCLTGDSCRTTWPTSGAGSVGNWFTGTTNFNQTANSTSTAVWFRGSPISLMASSTSVFDYASTTALSANTIYAANFIDTAFSGNNCIGESSGVIGQATNCVSSIASAGGTLTISSPTGNVDASLNLGHANTWTASTTFQQQTNMNQASTSALGVTNYVKVGNTIGLQPLPFGSGYSPFQIDGNINDGVGFNIFNRSTGSNAVSYIALNNNNTTLDVPGASAKYTANWVMGGGNWDGVPLGFGSLKKNDSALYVTDGNLIFGAATSSASHNVGNVQIFTGFAGSFTSGIPDFVFSDLGYLGIGTTTPAYPLSVVGFGGVVADIFTATSTRKSTFPYASTTALSVGGKTIAPTYDKSWAWASSTPDGAYKRYNTATSSRVVWSPTLPIGLSSISCKVTGGSGNANVAIGTGVSTTTLPCTTTYATVTSSVTWTAQSQVFIAASSTAPSGVNDLVITGTFYNQ